MLGLGGAHRAAPPRGHRPAPRATALLSHTSLPAVWLVLSSGLVTRPEHDSHEDQQQQQPDDAEDETREERHAERLQSAIGVA